MMIRSIRRAQEFSEFTIDECKSIKRLAEEEQELEQGNEQENEFSIKIKKHKTMQYGSEVFLYDTKEKP